MKINHRVPLLRHKDKDENEVLVAPNIFRAYDIRGIYPKDLIEVKKRALEIFQKIGIPIIKKTHQELGL